MNKITLDTDINAKVDGRKALGIIIGILLLIGGLIVYFRGLEEITGNTSTTKRNDRLTYDEKTDMYMYRVYP